MSRNTNSTGEIEPVPPQQSVGKNGYHPADLAEHSVPTPSSRLAPPRKSPWRMFAIPLLLALACGLTAFIVTNFFMTRWYRTGATLYFPATSGGGGGASGLLQQMTGASGGDTAVALNGGLYSTPLVATSPGMAMSVLATGRVQGKVMQDLHLDKQWHLPMKEAMDRLGKNVSWGVDRNGFLGVQAMDTNPQRAAAMVNGYINAMREVSTEMSTFYAKRNRKVLQAGLHELKGRLLSEQNDLVDIQTHVMRVSPLGTASTTAFAAIESQRQETEIDLRQAQALLNARLRVAHLTNQNATSLPVQMPYAQQANLKLHDLESQFAAVKAVYGPDYPQYQQLQAQVELAESQYKDEVKHETLAVQKGITPDVAQLMANVQGLREKLSGIHEASAPLRADLQSLPLDQMREKRIQDSVSLDTEQVRTMTLEVERAKEVEERNTPAFSIVDGAGAPDIPALPRIWFTTALAAVAGFMLGLAWKVGRSVSQQPALVGALYRLSEQYGLLETVSAPAILPARSMQNGLAPRESHMREDEPLSGSGTREAL